MPQRVTNKLAKALLPPPRGNRIVYDTEVSGFGIRITTGGARSFVLNYRFGGRERRYTIGTYGTDEWTVAGARKRAGELRRMIAGGEDPLSERNKKREAPTVADLVERFEREHLPKIRPSTQVEYHGIIKNEVLPGLRHLNVATIAFADIDALHRKITRRGVPYRANRTVAVLSKMFSLAIKWGWRSDNPTRGIERNQEMKRHRYLTGGELERLTAALAGHDDQQAANIIRMLLLTGARRGEVQAARWNDIDLEQGIWTKPGATTKQKTEHRVPLSAPALQLLVEIGENDTPEAEFIFPGNGSEGHRVEVKNNWAAICKAANISGARMHDLRHTYASVLASGGVSLPTIGALLGHTQASTTQRYAHLFDDPLRAATERVGAIVSGNLSAEIISFTKTR